MVNLRTFDLNLLRIFEAVSHDRSVSLAASKLGLSQPAVSNALNRLRRQFNDPLFVRTPKGMEPTPKGELLAASVHQGLATIRAGLTAGEAFDPATSDRRFTLLMTEVGEASFLPVLLATLKRDAPNIDLSVIEFSLEGYGELLESGVADIAIGRIKLSDTLCCELIHSSPFVILMSTANRYLQHDAHGQPFISFEDYLSAPQVLVEPRGASGDPISAALGSRAAERRIALSIPHAMVLPVIMTGTDLMATIPQVCVPNLAAGGELCAVPAPFPIDDNFVYQWWHGRNNDDAGHRWLRQIFSTAGV